jgi:hypothetical protein
MSKCTCVSCGRKLRNDPRDAGIKNGGRLFSNDCADLRDDLKCGGDWFSDGANASLQRRESSRSPRRKMASALIAKIPLPVSRHIARTYFPAAKTGKQGDLT